MPYTDTWLSAQCLNRAVGPSPCKHCGELPVGNGGPHRCPGSEREAREKAVADAVALLERSGYEVRRKDATPVAEP